MARKDVLISKILSGQSLSSGFTSPVTVIKYLDNMAYQINVSTTDSQGAFKVQGSLDYSPGGPVEGAANPGNWVDLAIGGTPSVAAANDQILINLNQLPFVAIRLVYTSSVAGTGSCDVYVAGKQIGG